MNPILPIQHFVPDVEARQWSDGRMYLYGSYDISGRTSYCSWEYHVFSSADLVHWEDHGESFRSGRSGLGRALDRRAAVRAGLRLLQRALLPLLLQRWTTARAWQKASPRPGLSPTPSPIEGADGDAIDPAVLVDDDGQVYYYWGQFHTARRKTASRSARHPARDAAHRPDQRGRARFPRRGLDPQARRHLLPGLCRYQPGPADLPGLCHQPLPAGAVHQGRHHHRQHRLRP